ncbi:MAG: thermonuclease family protein [Patescibacteria group bacterium]|jgi:micrococcal nuclease
MAEKLLAVLVVILTILFTGNAVVAPERQKISPSPKPHITASVSAYLAVTKVVDGDTIHVLIDGTKQTVRLIGVDTPEVVDPRKPVQCFGKEASARAKELLTGKSVKLENDPTQGDKDKYGRLLRYVFMEDGTNFNKKMIEDGYAHEYTYNLPYKYRDEFKQAERDARLHKRGLWADGVCL